MKSFRQFLEQITQQDYEAAQSAAENSPANRLQRIRERESQKKQEYQDRVKEIRAAQQELMANQAQYRREKEQERRQQREQERANRESGTD